MGHGKETPRQKMIGMMYLVLTALLALNVSKDILNAFANIDESITKAISNTVRKNDMLVAEFEKQNSINPNKVGPYYELAKKVKLKADSLCSFTHDSKKEIVKKADGEKAIEEMIAIAKEHAVEGIVVDENKIDIFYINSKDNQDVPAQVMVGSEGTSGRGIDLMKMIIDYREWLLKEIPDMSIGLQNSIKQSLNTDKQTHHGVSYEWPQANFEHLPLAGVISILSGIENGIRNVQTDVMNHLLAQIDAGSFKVNRLDAIVLGDNNIIRGTEGIHEIFIAASDSTADPKVLICDYTEKNENGIIDYVITKKYDSLSVSHGRGIYKLPSGSAGTKEYKGLIVLKNSDGTEIKRPFKQSYTVSEPQAVVSATKMNVFYLGLDNPVEISVPGVAANNIKVDMTNGSITKSKDGVFIAVPRAGAKICNIDVQAKLGDKFKSMGKKEFRIKTVPDPIAKVGGVNGGNIKKSVLAAQRVVIAELPDFLFDLKFDVTEFQLYTVGKGGFIYEAVSKSNQITEQQKNILNSLNPNQRVVFDEIKVRKPGNIITKIGSISLKVE